MMIVQRAVEFCFSPVGILAILLVAGFVISLRRRTSKAGARLLLAGAFLFVVFLFTPLAELVVAGLERPYPPMLNPGAAAGARYVVVLSGYGRDFPSVPVTSKLSQETIARMVEGIRLYRELAGAKLVVSGGVLRSGDPPVARLMAEFAQAMGVPQRDIIIEGTSRTTYENLVEVKKAIGQQRFVLVTSALDLWRATGVARKLRLNSVPAPAAIWSAQVYRSGMSWDAWLWQAFKALRPSPGRFIYLQWACHEYAGYAWYWLLGRAG